MKILQLFFHLFVVSLEVVLGVFIFGSDEVKLMGFLTLDFLDFVLQVGDFSIQSLVVEFSLSFKVFNLEILFLNNILQLFDV